MSFTRLLVVVMFLFLGFFFFLMFFIFVFFFFFSSRRRHTRLTCDWSSDVCSSDLIPYTLVHATQFFEFVRSIAQVSTEGNTVRVPPVAFQPIAADEVASAVAEAAVEDPVNGMFEIAGPEIFTLDEAVRKVLQHDHDTREVIADPNANYYGIKVAEKALVPGPNPRLGSTRLDWWLTHVPHPQKR